LALQPSLSQFLHSPYGKTTDKTAKTAKTNRNYIHSFLIIFFSFITSVCSLCSVVSTFGLGQVYKNAGYRTNSERSEREANPNLASKVWECGKVQGDMIDHIRKFKGWQRALRKFRAKHPPVASEGFRVPALTAEQVSQMEQNRRHRAQRSHGLKRRDYLVGHEFGHLLVLELAASDHAPWWWCLCACGNFLKLQSTKLILGRTTDCGCLKRERERIAKLRKAAA
jgi:hypothetical protein